jgi:hypothetical protein
MLANCGHFLIEEQGLRQLEVKPPGFLVGLGISLLGTSKISLQKNGYTCPALGRPCLVMIECPLSARSSRFDTISQQI